MTPDAVRKLRFLPAFLLLAFANCSDGKTPPLTAATIEPTSSTSFTAVAGTAVSPAPSVIVRDANGNPFPGTTITFTIASGGGSVTGATVVSDAAGAATVGSWTLGKAAGPNSLTASAEGITVTFNAIGVAGPTAALTISGGNNQTAVANTQLSTPPSVVVQDANGNAKEGVTVTFAVASGGGTVTGAAATSNSAGVATVGGWTLGPQAVVNTLTASTAGAPPVTFTATAISGCDARTTHTVGSTTPGSLSANDCQFADGSFVDYFSVTLPEANAYLFRETAGFDTYLDLALADGSVIAENNDEGVGSTNSTIKAILPPGTYRIGASSNRPATSGAYNISSQVTSTDNTNCQLVFAVRNISTTQGIATTDCLWTPIGFPPVYADAFYVLLRAGQSITADMSSSAVDPYLELVRLNGTIVASNDNRDGSTNSARITYTAAVTDYYAVVARTAGPSQTGAYSLSIQ
jgi:hypothetical protein